MKSYTVPIRGQDGPAVYEFLTSSQEIQKATLLDFIRMQLTTAQITLNQQALVLLLIC